MPAALKPPTTCLQCGKRFTAWRAKQYCSEACRKKAENIRRGFVRGDEKQPSATTLPDEENSQNLVKQNQRLANPFRGDEGFEWIACNEVTRKLTRQGSPTAVGWIMLIEGRGWFGRIGNEYSFGPAIVTRAMKAVEARLMDQPFRKLKGEKTRFRDCLDLVLGKPATRTPAPM